MHRIFLLGPQGCGKGTQAAILSERLSIPALSMGLLLREAAMGDSELANEIRSIQATGELVPGTIVTKVLKKRLENPDAKDGYIIDGFPRNQEQYEAYAQYDRPTAVIVIDVSREVSVERVMSRSRLEHRVDDTPEIVNRRLDIYYHDTNPMIDLYRQQGLVRDADGVGTIEEVADRIYGLCTRDGGC